MRKLIYLRRRGETLEWCNAATRETGEGDPDQLLEEFASQHLVFVLPGTEVTLTRVALPRQSPAKLRRAAPFALEERLAGNAESLHCALGHAVDDKHYAVAVVDQMHMDRLQKEMEEHGIEHAAALADVHCLPCPAADSDEWHMLYEKDHVTLRTGRHDGFACEPELLPEYLKLIEAPEGLEWRVSVSRDVLDQDSVRTSFETICKQFGIPDSAISTVTHPLHALAQPRIPDENISLLQGDYAIEPGYQRLLSPWKPAAALLGVWLIAGGVVQAMEGERRAQYLERLESDTANALKRAFPDIQRVTNLHGQAMQKLRSQGSDTSEANFMTLLAHVGSAVQAVDGLTLQEVQFRKGELSMSLTGPGVRTLDAVKNHFGARPGVNLEIESANAGAKGMQIRATLRQASRGSS